MLQETNNERHGRAESIECERGCLTVDIEFEDIVDEETDICSFCGATERLTGWNEEKELSRYECSECDAIVVYDDKGNCTVLKGKKRDWKDFLSQNLSFPFYARVDEHQGNIFSKEKGPLRYGDEVIVQGVIGESSTHGVIANVRKNKKAYSFQLCDLEVADERHANFKVLDNYRTWFANC